jgi:AraC family transcriptional regulator
MTNRTRENGSRVTGVGAHMSRRLVWFVVLALAPVSGALLGRPALAGVVKGQLHACPDASTPAELKILKVVPLGPMRTEHLGALRLAGPEVQLGKSAGGGTTQSIKRAWVELLHTAPTVKDRVGGLTYAVCYSLRGHRRFYYMPSVSVADLPALPQAYVEVTIQPQDYLVSTYTGPASGIANFRYSMTKFFSSDSKYHRTDAPNIEVYKEDYDPNSSAATMELWVAIEPNAPHSTQ